MYRMALGDNLFCENCGAERQVESKFCGSCGSALAATQRLPDSSAQPSSVEENAVVGNPQAKKILTSPRTNVSDAYFWALAISPLLIFTFNLMLNAVVGSDVGNLITATLGLIALLAVISIDSARLKRAGVNVSA